MTTLKFVSNTHMHLKKLLSLIFILSFSATAFPAEIQGLGTKLVSAEGNFYSWGSFTINLRVVDDNFILYFLDEERTILEPPVSLGTVRWETSRRIRRKGQPIRNEGDVVLLELSSNASALTSKRHVPPRPFYYVNLTLGEYQGKKIKTIQHFTRTRLNRTMDAEINDYNTHK